VTDFCFIDAKNVFETFLVPDGAPEKVHCVSLTSSSVQVSWHPPEVHLRNGVVKGYKVICDFFHKTLHPPVKVKLN
jgi:hypothetical protein